MSTGQRKLVGSIHTRVVHRRRPTGKRLKLHQAQAIQSIPAVSEILRVLVVDDCRDTVDSMGMLVEMWGYDARKACNGSAALEMAATYRPHVVLLDLGMPGMDGCHLASLLRQLPCHEDALLVAITGHTLDEQRGSCKQAGFDYFFLKPLSLAIVQRLLFLEQERLAQRAVALSGFCVQEDRKSPSLGLRVMVGDCLGARCFH